MKGLSVLLADDHKLVRAGFRSLLEKLGMLVVGEAGDGYTAVELTATLKPEIVLMDIAMPGLNGLEATARILQASPGVRILVVSMHATAEYARRAMRAGAAGYLVKDANAAELDLALRAVARGDTYLSPRISNFILADYAAGTPPETALFEKLTSRQREILQLIAEGNSRKGIAERLHISAKTFDTYRAQLMEHLDIHNVAGLVRFASRVGLIPKDE